MKNIILAILMLGTSLVYAKTAPQAGFVEVRPGHSLYVEHYPAAPGRPTLFVANGLTFNTHDYAAFVSALKELDPGVGIVLWDMEGMGETLLKYAPIDHRVNLDDQVADLRLLKDKLQIHGAASLAGLSYGGAVALRYAELFPNDFDAFIPIAPLLERLPDQDLWITNMANWHITYARLMPYNFSYYMATVRSYCLKNMVYWHHIFWPQDHRSEADLTEYYQKYLTSADWLERYLRPNGLPDTDNFDEVYDFYLRILIYSTYWIPEPSVLENQYKLEGVFRMVQGVKNWNAFVEAEHLPTGKIHAIAAKQDEHVKLDRMEAFWARVPKTARGSFLMLDHSRHKITTEWPKISAAWILHVLNGDPNLQRGLVFEGDPLRGEAKSGSTRIPLKQEGDCESILRKVSKLSQQ